MDITTLAAWGEFLGGIAVVVSLIYLAGQNRPDLGKPAARIDYAATRVLANARQPMPRPSRAREEGSGMIIQAPSA